MRVTKRTVLNVLGLLVSSIALAQTALDILNTPNGTLHDAAVANGGRLVKSDFIEGGWIDMDLQGLARASDIIVVGSTVDNICQLTADQKSIETMYRVRVEQKLKGNVHPGDELNVALPGGLFTFPDGVFVRINTPGYPKMVNGAQFVLFLSLRIPGRSRLPLKAENTGPTFEPTSDMHGLFELLPDSSVKPYARSVHQVSKHWGKSQVDFIDEVREAIKKPEEK